MNIAIINLALNNARFAAEDAKLTPASRQLAQQAYDAIECWFVRLDGTVFVPVTISPEAKRLVLTWGKVS